MNFWGSVKRHRVPLASLVAILSGGIIVFVLFVLLGCKKNARSTSKKVSITEEERQILDNQFIELYGQAYFEHLEAFDETDASRNIQQALDLANNCKYMHSHAKQLKKKEPGVSKHKSLDYETFRDYLKAEEPAKSKVITDAETLPKSLLVSYDAALKMSPAELDTLERTSSLAAAEEYGKPFYRIHMANAAVAMVLKKGKPSAVQQTTFEAWKGSGLSAEKFTDLLKEGMQHYSKQELAAHYDDLVDHATSWHRNMTFCVRLLGEHLEDVEKHHSHDVAIQFIYRALVTLNDTDGAELEKCIKEESIDGIRALARKTFSSSQYAMLENIKGKEFKYEDIDKNVAEHGSLTLLAYAFHGEILLAQKERNQTKSQTKLLSHAFAFDMNAIKTSKDVSNAYNECINKVPGNEDSYCYNAINNMWEITTLRKYLEDITNKINGTAKNIYTSTAKNVLEPAIILLNSKSLLNRLDNAVFITKLKEYDIHSYEQALQEKRKLMDKDYDLYKRLLLIKKCREYVQHENDPEYIRENYESIYSAFQDKVHIKKRKDRACKLLKEFVRELKKGPSDQACSFDFSSKQIICKTPILQEKLVEAQYNDYASKMLSAFCQDVMSMKSVPMALAALKTTLTKAHETAILADINVLIEIRRDRYLG